MEAGSSDISASEERAARFAYIASRYEWQPSGPRRTAYLKDDVGVPISGQTAERAINPVRFSPPTKGQRGRPGTRVSKETPALWDWVLVDERQLGLIKVLIRIEGGTKSPGRLADDLRALDGVRQVIETTALRDLFAVAIYRTPVEEANARAQLEELTNREIVWDQVREEAHRPAQRTWRDLARREASEAGLDVADAGGDRSGASSPGRNAESVPSS